VRTPDGQSLPPEIRPEGPLWRVRFAQTCWPGVYELTQTDDDAPPAIAAPSSNRFGVEPDPGESVLTPLAADEWAAAGQYVDLRQAESLDQLVAAIQGQRNGTELWPYLVGLALALLLLELLAGRWVARRRKLGQAESVLFSHDDVAAETRRRHATKRSQPCST
jgi:hypothetical protein